MLNNNTKKNLPKDYAYKKADWYIALKRKYDNYRFTLIRILLLFTSLIPFSFGLYDVLHGTSGFLLNYAIPFVFLMGLLLLLMLTKKIELFVIITMLSCVIGFILTLFLPNARNVSILIFFCFPPIAFQLSGTRKGSLWIIFFFAIVLSLLFARYIGYEIPMTLVTPYFGNIVMGAVALVLISIITYFGERQHEKEIDLVVRNILFDETTRLPNRMVLNHSIKKKSCYLFSIILIENFSDLGIIFGYDLSDEILLFFSSQLKELKKSYNYTIFRLKGNEFGILLKLERYDKDEAVRKLTDIRSHLQSTAMPWENSELRLNIMIGGVIFNSDNPMESTDILSKADMALKACNECHQGVTLFEDHQRLKASAFHSINLFSVLYNNHENNYYKAFYQPIVHSLSEEIVWYESLLRIKNSDGLYESPVKYLAIAESTGLDTSITRFMIMEACKALRSTDKNISVNITFRDMIRPEFLELLILHLGRTGTCKGKLILEILERNELTEVEACNNFLSSARELGCLIAIDDFGSGYSNYGNLLNMPVDIIKLNGSLVQQLKSNTKARKMIENIILFCKQTDLLITAECVDSRYLADDLKTLGVDYLQGYHFGKPAEITWE